MLFKAKRIRENENDGMVYFHVESGSHILDVAIRKTVYNRINEEAVKNIILSELFSNSEIEIVKELIE